MPIEIERKFLVVNDDWRAQASRRLVMRQGYLAGEDGRSSVRVRLQGAEARLNIKAAVVGRARAEYDYEVPLKDAHEILDSLCVGLVDKTRHYIDATGPDGRALTWEIDEFAGANAGLVVAEVELESVDQPLPQPAWLGMEVTDDRRYYNHALALTPWRDWPENDKT